MISRFYIFVVICLGCIAAHAETPQADTLRDQRVAMIFSDCPHLPAGKTMRLLPSPLKPGDTIAIVSPAGEAHTADFESIAATIERHGYHARIMPHAGGISGSYSGTAGERLSDLREALQDRSVKAILCTRGGYGAVQLIEGIDTIRLEHSPKWLVGFSDVSALHAVMQNHGICSIHGPMGINVQSTEDEESPSVKALFEILEGKRPEYIIENHEYNRAGDVQGTLMGGNMAVIDGLVGTPYDVMRPGVILFIEDVGEPIYKIQRQLYKLKLSGVLGRLKGLIVGDFSGAEGDANHSSMEQMIREMVEEYDYPVAFGVPAGHERVNIPLILGASVKLTVGDNHAIITQ